VLDLAPRSGEPAPSTARRNTTERLRKEAVVVDTQPIWLDALGSLLARLSIETLARSSDLDHAFDLAREHRPDLLLVGLDSAAVEQELLDEIRQLKEAQPETNVIVLSAGQEPRGIAATLAAGASGYCMRHATAEDLGLAVRQCFERSIYLSRAPYDESDRDLRSTERHTPGCVPGLTPRETEILRLAAEGHTNARLARMLWVTEQTVKFHLSNTYRKLGVANRTEASRWAERNGLLSAGGRRAG
jgi:DNA-binding NarL/FixJ family response regulator